jgi:hypothetical protein
MIGVIFESKTVRLRASVRLVFADGQFSENTSGKLCVAKLLALRGS